MKPTTGIQNQPFIVRVEDLKTYFTTLDGIVRAVDGVSLEVHPGEALGLVGESGCGKSVTAFSILRLLPKTSRIVQGKILFDRGTGEPPIDLTDVDPNGDLIRSIRGNEIAMIFQEPLTSLSPVHTVGSQIAEAVELHQIASARQSHQDARGCGHCPARATLWRVSPPVFRGDAAAGHDRHGPVLQPGAPHRR
jgi:ABC-type dipeptide/oligopeptide/nickel transport system ATPase component